eukprot:1194448-Prorocentrum_minimum.AAC.8
MAPLWLMGVNVVITSPRSRGVYFPSGISKGPSNLRLSDLSPSDLRPSDLTPTDLRPSDLRPSGRGCAHLFGRGDAGGDGLAAAASEALGDPGG